MNPPPASPLHFPHRSRRLPIRKAKTMAKSKMSRPIQKKKATQGQVTFDALPDDVLLSVFDCYVDEDRYVEAWSTLIRVCRRWRNVVFGSPRRLHLRIACTSTSYVMREKLDAWPRLPIVVSGYCDSMACLDNVKAALEHSDRVCQIELMVNPREIPVKDVFNALEKPFPALTDLDLSLWPLTFLSIYLDLFKFLMNSSHLRSLSLGGITLPLTPLFSSLLSSMNLNTLHLHNIPQYLNLNPEVTATTLSALTSLETLSLRFMPSQIPFYLGNKEGRHPFTRSVIPSLLCFDFEGDSRYLEALVARIDTPVLDRLGIIFRQPTPTFWGAQTQILDATQLLWLLSRIPKMQALDEAHVKLDNHEVWIDFWSNDLSALRLGFSSIEPERGFPHLARFFGLPFNPFPILESLYIVAYPLEQHRWDRIMNATWLEFLRPFVAVKNLHLSKEITPRIALALKDLVGERAREVFPALQNVSVEEHLPNGSVYDGIMQFAAARRLSGHPIDILVPDLYPIPRPTRYSTRKKRSRYG